MDVMSSVCIVKREAIGARVWEVKCIVMQMLYVCVHPVAFLNAALCMTSSLFMLVKNARGAHMEEAYSITSLMTAL